jgi:hypothetical protein
MKSNAENEGSMASPACPSDKNSIKMQMSMVHLWNGTHGKIELLFVRQ